jgi:hypothetical protein
MLKIYLENGKALVLERAKKKLSIGTKPEMLSENDMVYIWTNRRYSASYARYFSESCHFAQIQVAGTVYDSASETVAAISELCSVFNSVVCGGGTSGTGGVTIAEVKNAIEQHNLDTDAHPLLPLIKNF